MAYAEKIQLPSDLMEFKEKYQDETKPEYKDSERIVIRMLERMYLED